MMKIRFSKTRDGFALTYTRADGTSTFTKPKHGQFFILHDLMHYCVETTLSFTQAFLGLLEAGRTIDSFNEPGGAKNLPAQAVHAEFIVNCILQRQQWNNPLSADEINAELAAAVESDRGTLPAPPTISQAQIDAIVNQHADLVARFTNLNVGEFFELPFPIAS